MNRFIFQIHFISFLLFIFNFFNLLIIVFYNLVLSLQIFLIITIFIKFISKIFQIIQRFIINLCLQFKISALFILEILNLLHFIYRNRTFTIDPFSLNEMFFPLAHNFGYAPNIRIGYKSESSRLLSSFIFQNNTVF